VRSFMTMYFAMQHRGTRTTAATLLWPRLKDALRREPHMAAACSTGLAAAAGRKQEQGLG
jgi:hypothetical protein